MLFQSISWGLGATASAFVGGVTKVLRSIDFNTTVHGDLPAMWRPAFEAALKRAPNSAAGIQVGSVPFARLVNLISGREYVPTYSQSTRILKIAASPSSPWPWKNIDLPLVYFIDDTDTSLIAYFDKYGNQVGPQVGVACNTGGDVLGILHLEASGAVAERVRAAACARYKVAPPTAVSSTRTTSAASGRQVVTTSRDPNPLIFFPGGGVPPASADVPTGPPIPGDPNRQSLDVIDPGAAPAPPPPPPAAEPATPFYKKPIFWAVTGVVVIGGGATYLLTRPRKALAGARRRRAA